MSFDQLQKELRDLPVSWYPQLLKTLVEESHKAGVWTERGCVLFVEALIKELKPAE